MDKSDEIRQPFILNFIKGYSFDFTRKIMEPYLPSP